MRTKRQWCPPSETVERIEGGGRREVWAPCLSSILPRSTLAAGLIHTSYLLAGARARNSCPLYAPLKTRIQAGKSKQCPIKAYAAFKVPFSLSPSRCLP